MNSLQIVVPVIASTLAFFLGRRVEAYKNSPQRAAKFILDYLVDGNYHAAPSMKLDAAEAGISGESYTEACFYLGPNDTSRIEGITRDGIPYVRLAANA